MGSSGESPLRPLFVGAYGTGPKPVILRRPRGFKHPHVKNLVFQDVHFKAGFSLLERFDNVMFDHVDFSDTESSFMGQVMRKAPASPCARCKFLDAYHETVKNEGGAWDPNANRMSGFYMQDIDGVLIDGVFMAIITAGRMTFSPMAALKAGNLRACIAIICMSRTASRISPCATRSACERVGRRAIPRRWLCRGQPLSRQQCRVQREWRVQKRG